jgi:hypothetical protein
VFFFIVASGAGAFGFLDKALGRAAFFAKKVRFCQVGLAG